MTSIKLVIADVDGTLVTREKVLTERARDSVQRLREAGIQFTITSGRPPRGMASLTRQLKLTTPITAFNGGVIIQPDLKTVIEQRVLPRDIAEKVVEYFLGQGIDVWVYRGSDWFIRNPNAPHADTEHRTVQFAPTVIGNLYNVLEGAVKIVGVSDNASLLIECEEELKKLLGKSASAARSQPYYLDVTHPDANKGTVVHCASRLLQVSRDEIAVMGDMPNDVLMFKAAGMSIAMGNASAEVKSSAQFVTTSNEDEGFANAIDCFILKKSCAPLWKIA